MLTYFDEPAGKHLFLDLVFERERLLVKVILKATEDRRGEEEKRREEKRRGEERRGEIKMFA